MGALSSFFFVKTSKSKLLGFTPANIYLKYDNSSQDGILVTHITSTADRTGEERVDWLGLVILSLHAERKILAD